MLGFKVPVVRSATDLLEVAKRLDASALEAANGWRTEPPFPGYGETPQELPNGWRMMCASNVFVGNEHLGVIFITLISGKPVAVVMNQRDSPIPSSFKAVH
jgi:hypothetical protein